MAACSHMVDPLFAFVQKTIDEEGMEKLSEHLTCCISCSIALNDLSFEILKEKSEKKAS